jgi:hypothetical protein
MGVKVALRVIVRLKGTIGLDDAGRLLAELADETGLDWSEERVPDGKHLGVADLLLTAVISGAAGKSAEAAAEAAGNRVRQVISRWRDRRLDPPDAEIETQETPAEQPEARITTEAETAG